MKEYYTVFPHDEMINGSVRHDYGINVRDYIAIQAMKAIISNTSYVPEYSASEVAHLAYDYADEMIKRSEI